MASMRTWPTAGFLRPNGALARAANGAVVAAFVPVQMPPAEAEPKAIRIELRKGTPAITVSWPCAAAVELAAWMRELLR